MTVLTSKDNGERLEGAVCDEVNADREGTIKEKIAWNV